MSQRSNPLAEATSIRTLSLTQPEPQAWVTPARHVTHTHIPHGFPIAMMGTTAKRYEWGVLTMLLAIAHPHHKPQPVHIEHNVLHPKCIFQVLLQPLLHHVVPDQHCPVPTHQTPIWYICMSLERFCFHMPQGILTVLLTVEYCQWYCDVTGFDSWQQCGKWLYKVISLGPDQVWTILAHVRLPRPETKQSGFLGKS